MKRNLLIVLFALFCTMSISAQAPKLPSECKAWLPKALNHPILIEKDIQRIMTLEDYGMSESKTNVCWVAYSDRANNPTYVSPSTSAAQYKTLQFNEEVRIAEVRDGFALVYSEPGYATGLKISADAECLGWVPMTKLLLWRSCLADEHGIRQKALLCVNLDVAGDVENLGMGAYDPNGAKNVRLKSDMNFYYVMKRENGMTLLSSQSQFDGALTNKVLLCWVPDNLYVPCNQRLFLEPTWNHADVDYFYSKGIRVGLYGNAQLTGSPIAEIGFQKKYSPKKHDMYLYRMDGNALRYPVLDNGTAAIYSMSTFSTLGGDSAVQVEDAGKGDEGIATILKLRSHIDIGFVIDGTSSMERFYPAIKEAIKEGCKYFNQQTMTIRVGVVIYRDYADGEKGLVEVMPLTPISNISRINAFLDSGGEYGIRSSKKDTSETEALYYGINTALDKLGFKKEHSNMMIVVGDCGNAEGDKSVTEKELNTKIIEKDINVFGFQVQNKPNTAYSSFSDQVVGIIRKSLTDRYKELNGNFEVKQEEVYNAQGELIGYDFDAEVNKNIYAGNFRNSDAGINNGVMDPRELTKLVNNAFHDLSTSIQGQLDIIGDARKIFEVMDGDQNSKQGVRVEDSFLLSVLPQETIYAMRRANSLITFQCYAPKKDASGRNFFKEVVFMSRDEYLLLMKRLQPVYEAAKEGSQNREPYINAMKAMIGALAGYDWDEIEMMTSSEITRMVCGLSMVPEGGKRYTIEDLANPRVVSDEDFYMIRLDFMKKYNSLQRVGRQDYQYKKEFNNAIYYWIPLEDFPL